MIRVEINNGRFHPINHDVLIGERIVKALKDAGIPVIADAFVLRGIQRGRLVYTMGPTGTHIYEWNESDGDNSSKWVRTSSKDSVVTFKNGVHLEDDEL